MKERLLTATGQSNIDRAIARFTEFETVGAVDNKEALISECKKHQPDILLIGEGLNGKDSTVQVILNVKRIYPEIRIVYLAGHINMSDESRVSSIALLGMSGIYDVIHEKTMTGQMLKEALLHPKTEKHLEPFMRHAKKSMNKVGSDAYVDFVINEETSKEADENQHIINNLYVMSSIKPGTGKSFLSVNVATAIAQYGVNNSKGERPRVALIEADLQNLSIGTLLQIEDPKRNIKTAMDKISEVITPEGLFIGNDESVRDVSDFVLKTFLPYYRVKNLQALVGSQLSLEQVTGIHKFHYPYLIQQIAPHFDVIIVDTNSALTHVTSQQILHMAKTCYYIINLDFNNIRNNARYKGTLEEMNILSKVKYILNEDIRGDSKSGFLGTDEEALIYTAQHLEDSGFKLEAKIPTIPKTIFLNGLYNGKPIVLDDRRSTQEVKFELLKVANQIYPIKKFAEMEQDMLANNTNKKKKR